MFTVLQLKEEGATPFNASLISATEKPQQERVVRRATNIRRSSNAKISESSPEDETEY